MNIVSTCGHVHDYSVFVLSTSSYQMAAASKANCALSLLKNLDELKRRQDVESLRPFLAAEGCFPSSKNPEHAAITMEELKKLARAWKLHGMHFILICVYTC